MPFLPPNQECQSTECKFPMLKCKCIFPTKYTEAGLSNSTRILSWFVVTKMLIAVKKTKFLVSFVIIFGTLSFPISDQAGSSVTITSEIVDASSLILFHKCFHCRSFLPVNCNMTLDSCYPLYFSIKAHIFSRPHQISSLWRTTIHTHREGHIDTHTTAHSN